MNCGLFQFKLALPLFACQQRVGLDGAAHGDGMNLGDVWIGLTVP
jgi:hypothetical protein